MTRRLPGYRPFIVIVLVLTVILSVSWYQRAVQAYDVVVDGRTVAQVKDEAAFRTALEKYRQLVSDQVGYPVQELQRVELQQSRLNKNIFEKNVNKVVLKEIHLGVKAYRFVADGETVFAVNAEDKDRLDSLISEYKLQYLAGIDEGAEIKQVDFKQDVRVEEALLPPSELIDIAEAREFIFEKDREAKVIEVEKGDNLWLIAQRYDMTVEEIEILNPELNPEKIYPGDKLVVEPFDPRFDVVILMENTVVEPVPFETESLKDDDLYSRQKIVVKPGEAGKKRVTYDIALLNGLEDSLTVVNEEVIEEPVTRVVRVGTKQTVSRGGQRNYGVVQGSRVSSGYGWRTHPITGRRSFHDGVDIAARSGSGVYAYAEGTVTFAGWNGGYGRVIYVDHGSGLVTRYAHLSRIDVRKGERVNTGERIGAVGSSGSSTGPHLHFEVLQSGSTRNPWNYL